MDSNKIAILKSFEGFIKKNISKYYNGIILDDMLSFECINDETTIEFLEKSTVQGYVIREIFKTLLNNVICVKQFDFSNGEKISIEYGYALYNGLVEYFARDLSSKMNLKINKNDDYDVILNFLALNMNDELKKIVFNENASIILERIGNDVLTEYCDNNAVKKYISDKQAKKDKSDMFLSIAYINGSQYIKYIDHENNIKFVRTHNSEEILNEYRNELSKLSKNENLNSKDFFEKLISQNKKLSLETTGEFDRSRLLKSEKEMLDRIYPSKNKQNTNVTEAQEELKLITEQEYEKLCNKAINKKLTDHELHLLELYDKHYYEEEVEEESKVQTENAPVPKLQKKNNSGFAQKNSMILFTFLALILGAIFGMLLFKILK